VHPTESYKFEGEVDKSKKLECEVDKIEFINIMTVKNGELGKPTMIYFWLPRAGVVTHSGRASV
jgi:hypothetical protein